MTIRDKYFHHLHPDLKLNVANVQKRFATFLFIYTFTTTVYVLVNKLIV